MKKTIRSDNYLSYLRYYIDVDVFYEPVGASEISASSIRPIFNDSGEIDDQALMDYQAFVEECEVELEDAGLDILEENQSKSYPYTSYYYVLCDASQHRLNEIKRILILRISDHKSKQSEKEKSMTKQHRNMLKDKYGVKYKLAYFIVNGHQYTSYDQAQEEIIKRAQAYVQRLN